jgi:hypothetical protein
VARHRLEALIPFRQLSDGFRSADLRNNLAALDAALRNRSLKAPPPFSCAACICTAWSSAGLGAKARTQAVLVAEVRGDVVGGWQHYPDGLAPSGRTQLSQQGPLRQHER